MGRAMPPCMTDHFKRIGPAFHGLVTFETELRKGLLEPALLHLVKMRARPATSSRQHDTSSNVTNPSGAAGRSVRDQFGPI